MTIEGDQALSFVRARKIDDDFGRIRRQQLFLKLMVDKIASPGTLLHPDKVFSLVNVFSKNVKHDAELNLGDITTIGLRLRAFNSGNLDLRVVPSSGARIKGVSYVVANEAPNPSFVCSDWRRRHPAPIRPYRGQRDRPGRVTRKYFERHTGGQSCRRRGASA